MVFRKFKTFLLYSLIACWCLEGIRSVQAQESSPNIKVISSLRVYSDIAQQIGGRFVHSEAILSGSLQDPHLFELPPMAVKTIEHGAVFIRNGMGYDNWFEKILTSHVISRDKMICVSCFLALKENTNPHLWFSVPDMKKLAIRLSEKFSALLPTQKVVFADNLARFEKALDKIEEKQQEIRQRFSGLSYAATEPVFNIMLDSLGFHTINLPFQMAMMNETEPSPQEIALLEMAIQSHKIRLFFYNTQVITPLSTKITVMAKEARIPVIGVSESLPVDKNYQDWMNLLLNTLVEELQKK
nr:zinc ABC transporter substrate-binding protein [Entomobacter blattae]